MFAEATYDGRQFNKLVVFDEAHKYIDSPDLVAGLVDNSSPTKTTSAWRTKPRDVPSTKSEPLKAARETFLAGRDRIWRGIVSAT